MCIFQLESVNSWQQLMYTQLHVMMICILRKNMLRKRMFKAIHLFSLTVNKWRSSKSTGRNEINVFTNCMINHKIHGSTREHMDTHCTFLVQLFVVQHNSDPPMSHITLNRLLFNWPIMHRGCRNTYQIQLWRMNHSVEIALYVALIRITLLHENLKAIYGNWCIPHFDAIYCISPCPVHIPCAQQRVNCSPCKNTKVHAVAHVELFFFFI